MHTAQNNQKDPCDPLPAHRSFVAAKDVGRMKHASDAWLSRQEPNVNCAAGRARAGCAFHVDETTIAFKPAARACTNIVLAAHDATGFAEGAGH